MNQYRRFCTELNDKGKLIPANDRISEHAKIGTQYKEYFTSIYKYNQEQYEAFQKTGSVAGVTDVVIDRLVFDFDGKKDGKIPAPELAIDDTIEMCNRLISAGFEEKNLQIFFSGASGFHVEVPISEDISVDEFKAITKQMSNGLPTYDTKVSNPSRIFRAVGSINFKTNLYKIPLTFSELKTSTVDQIQASAKSFNVDRNKFNWEISKLPDTVIQMKNFAKDFKTNSTKTIDTGNIDWDLKPKWLSKCRFSLQNGFFGAGERNSALMVLAAKYKNQGFDKGATYRLLKAVAQKQSDKSGQDRYSDDEIWVNIVEVVYHHNWKGGEFSCRNPGDWLYDYCQSMGNNKCAHNDDSCFIEIDDFASKFSIFAKNIDQNTLKLGVPQIDEKVMITTSMLVGLLGAPSVGKTTLLLNFLEQSNKDNIDSVFFSMDMGLPLVYLRLIQKHFGYTKNEVFDLFLTNPTKVTEIIETIKESYKHTKFSFKTGMTVADMRNAVLDHQEKTQRKVKLIGIDYLECISGPFSDATANSGVIANQLKDLANDLDVCVMLLLQTQKQSGDPSDPLLSMRNVKGSSVTEQACSVILSMSRPGFSPITPENDKFATISSVKDRMGSLVSEDVGWEGLRGRFTTLTDDNRKLLNQVRADKQMDKDKANVNNKPW